MNKISLTARNKTEKNKKQLFVSVTARRDVALVKQYLKEIMERKNNREANILSLHIIYGRMFSKNYYDLPTLKVKNIVSTLTTDEKILHDRLIKMRNKIFALAMRL